MPSRFKENYKEDFDNRIKEKINNGDYCFRQIHFPSCLNFRDFIFENDVDFYGAVFDGREDISETQKRMPACVNFTGAVFKKNVIFEQSQFNAGDALFIESKFLGEKANFNGAQFKGGYGRFTKAEFNNSEKTDFDGAKFHKGANFKSAQFNSKEIGFWEGEVKEGHAFFWGVKFAGNRINLSNIKINGGNAEFNDSIFEETDVIIENSQFSQNVAFNRTKFNKSPINIINSTINGNFEFDTAEFSDCSLRIQVCQISHNLIFNDAQFNGDALIIQETTVEGNTEFNKTNIAAQRAILDNVRFNGNLHFIETKFKIGMNFSKCFLGPRSAFRMENIYLEFLNNYSIEPIEQHQLIIFERFTFNPFITFFTDMRIEKAFNINEDDFLSPIIFRSCQLKDVQFIRNNMALFSFYSSTYEEARFFSSAWSRINDRIFFIKYWRKNIINEEKTLRLLANISNESEVTSIKKHYMLEDISGYYDIASFYRSMKTALDLSKDYQEAGSFYFNEFEMKRLAFKNKLIQISKMPFKYIRIIFSKYFLYSCYKVFAGYGEKPLWSAIWFVIYSALAAIFQLFSGIQLKVGTKIINYDLSSNIGTLFSGQLWRDICETWKYSVYRLIPNNYFTSKDSTFIPIDDWGVFLTIVNTVILALFIVFIGIGLKRHFRRF